MMSFINSVEGFYFYMFAILPVNIISLLILTLIWCVLYVKKGYQFTKKLGKIILIYLGCSILLFVTLWQIWT